jgi:WD40 repeat protein
MSFAAVLERLQRLENPYPGLRTFERGDQRLFFGRDQQIAELVARLQQNRFVAVVGVSGGGKSSLVLAGLLPALERGCVGEASPQWRMVVTRPGGRPFDNLTAALQTAGVDPTGLRTSSYGMVKVAKRLPAEQTLLIVVDQFEEIFRYKDRKSFALQDSRDRRAESSEAAEFVQLLLSASGQQPPVYVILTMRSDYLGDCAEFHDLPEALNRCQYLVPRLSREQRKQAIEGPLGSTRIESSLVQRILNDAGDEPEQLPVLQHALMRTWRQWRNTAPNEERGITLEDYLAEPVGGLQHALDRHAEELLGNDQEQIAIAEKIFKRLTTGTQREHRNPARLSELWDVCGADDPDKKQNVVGVINRFRSGEATFLRPREEEVALGKLGPEDYIDITHESLIREWTRLREWVADESEARAYFLRIYEDAKRNQEKEDLWRDPRLQMALDWWKVKQPNAVWARAFLGNGATGEAGFLLTRDFLEKSRIARDADASRRRRRLLATRLITLTAIAVMACLILWGIRNQRRMKSEHQIAMARALAWESYKDQIEHPTEVERSALYAVESVKREVTADTLQTLQNASRLLSRNVLSLHETGYIWGLDFSPQGYLATAYEGKAVNVYSSDGRKLIQLPIDWAVLAVRFSDDGSRLAAAGEGGIAVFETHTWHELWNEQRVRNDVAVEFSPDGRLLASASLGNHLYVWDISTGQEIWKRDYAVRAIAFSSDGRYLASGEDDGLRLTAVGGLDQRRYRQLWQIPTKAKVQTVAFSPDGRYIAAGDVDGNTRIYDIQRRLLHQWNQKGALYSLAFSPDGRYLATGGNDGLARIRNVASEEEEFRQAHQGPVLSVVFSRHQNVLASGSTDGIVQLTGWSSPEQLARIPLAAGRTAHSGTLSWDSRYLAEVDDDGTVQVVDLKIGKILCAAIRFPGGNQVGVSSGGTLVAISGGKRFEVLETSTGVSRFSQSLPDLVRTIDLSADGDYLAVATKNAVRLYDLSKSAIAWMQPQTNKSISVVTFNSDGTRLAVGGEEPKIVVFATATGSATTIPFHWNEENCKEPVGPCRLNGAAFSRDGLYLALAASDKTARLINVPKAIEYKVFTLPAAVVYAVLSSDDKYLATATTSSDMAGRVYEVSNTNKEVWHMLLDSDAIFPFGFLSGDKYLLGTRGNSEFIVERYLWRPDDLKANVCSHLTRNLTADEWHRLFNEAPPRSCP